VTAPGDPRAAGRGAGPAGDPQRPDRPRGRLWPDRRQELLLQAALLPGPGAVDAWARLGPDLDLGRLDRGSERLLPLIWWNLRPHGLEDPLLGRLEAHYRATREKNAAGLRQTASLLEAFRRAGIPTLVLKGAALLGSAYADLGLRPMSDVDLLVPIERVAQASRTLEALGWTAEAPVTPSMTRMVHALPFRRPSSIPVDLHWHVFEECCRPDDDDDLWAASVPRALEGVATRILAPEDQVIHACVHGEKWVQVPGVRWVADAAVVIRGGQVRWTRLVEQAVRRRFVLRLRAQLGYLRSAFDAPIPPEALAMLAAAPVSRLERFEARWSVRDRRRPWVLVYWCNHLRSSPGGLATTLVTFPRYLQATWRLPSLARVPGATVGRLVRSMAAPRPGSRGAAEAAGTRRRA
jgi:hypothetical protein